MNAKHTPTPWVADGREVISTLSGIPTTICECFDHSGIGRKNAESDAAHIVRCVNSHDDLLAVLTIRLKVIWL